MIFYRRIDLKNGQMANLNLPFETLGHWSTLDHRHVEASAFKCWSFSRKTQNRAKTKNRSWQVKTWWFLVQACENAKLDMHITYTHTHTSQECCFSNWILYLCNFTRASTMTATYNIIAHVCAFNCSHDTSQIHAVENRSWLGIQACPLRRLDNVVVPRLWNHLNLSGWSCTCMFSAIFVCTVI